MKLILIMAFLLATTTAMASGSRVGNGGDGVVCKDSAGAETPVELLDLYEASYLYDRLPEEIFATSLDDALDFYQQELQDVLSPDHPFLKIFDQISILRANLVLRDGPFVPTPDLGLFSIEKNCHITQIAVRGADPSPDDLEVSRDFWMTSSAQVQALFLLHEAAHDWFAANGLDGTLPIRQLIGVLYTSSMISLSDQSLVRSLIETRQALPAEEIKNSQ